VTDAGPTLGYTPLVGLRWAIKRSFLDYIARAPGGSGSLSDGALATEGRQVVFGPGRGLFPVPDSDYRSLAFRGTVTFRAYSGALFVRIANPSVVIRGGAGDLAVDNPFDAGSTARLRLATFDIEDYLVADGFEHWAAGNVRLAPESCELFNNVYPAGELMEPMTIILAHGR